MFWSNSATMYAYSLRCRDAASDESRSRAVSSSDDGALRDTPALHSELQISGVHGAVATSRPQICCAAIPQAVGISARSAFPWQARGARAPVEGGVHSGRAVKARHREALEAERGVDVDIIRVGVDPDEVSCAQTWGCTCYGADLLNPLPRWTKEHGLFIRTSHHSVGASNQDRSCAGVPFHEGPKMRPLTCRCNGRWTTIYDHLQRATAYPLLLAVAGSSGGAEAEATGREVLMTRSEPAKRRLQRSTIDGYALRTQIRTSSLTTRTMVSCECVSGP